MPKKRTTDESRKCVGLVLANDDGTPTFVVFKYFLFFIHSVYVFMCLAREIHVIRL